MTADLPILTTNPAHTIFTPRRKAAFLTQLAQSGNVRLACRAAGVSPQTAYRARRASPALEQAWDAALIAAKPIAEQVLADRALNGVEEPVFYHGEEVARRTRFDARLLLAHIGRLDALAAEPEMDAALRDLDAHIATLESGEELAEPIDPDAPWYGDEEDELEEDDLDEDEFPGGMDWRSAHSGAEDGGVETGWAPAGAGAHEDNHNPVPGVPSCRETPPSSSAAIGQTETPSSSAAAGPTKTSSNSAAIGQKKTPSVAPDSIRGPASLEGEAEESGSRRATDSWARDDDGEVGETPPEDKGSFLQPWPSYKSAQEGGESPNVSRRDAEEAETQSSPASPSELVAGSIVRL